MGFCTKSLALPVDSGIVETESAFIGRAIHKTNEEPTQMKATNALVAAAVAGVLAAGTSVVSASLTTEHAVSAEKKKDDCPGKDKKEKDDCPGKKKEEKKGTIL